MHTTYPSSRTSSQDLYCASGEVAARQRPWGWPRSVILGMVAGIFGVACTSGGASQSSATRPVVPQKSNTLHGTGATRVRLDGATHAATRENLQRRILVNQLGYFPAGPKRATVLSGAKRPLQWKLLSQEGNALAVGTTTPFGMDKSSGENVHWLDFSAYKTTGKNLVLAVGAERSYPFDIETALYEQLKYDAFRYFYHNRSGVELKLPFTVKKEWSRPAGHANDVASCMAADKLKATGWDEALACDYELDVSGGWYDAGDHGKYVVNGGISVWTLLNHYERAKHLSSKTTALGDVRAVIPESGNGVPDVLDEARHQMEFLLRMQIPRGKPRAGMVHHKVHDDGWTALGMAPHEDRKRRLLRPPSTAATLNLSATAAQAARIWRTIDENFAQRCLVAAEEAWRAAEKYPRVLASAKDSSSGGGAYGDDLLQDEFYWAAAELFVTTGAATYKEAILASELDKQVAVFWGEEGGGSPTAMTWQRVDSLGKISLAVVPNDLGNTNYRKQLQAAADLYLDVIRTEGFRTPLRVGTEGKYPWGSNSLVLNNMVVLGLAYDFTQEAQYLGGVVDGIDYLLGRNALGQSYVTGYGERPLVNPHHRFWSHQKNKSFPMAPPGCVSGGPNSSVQDKYAQGIGLTGCAPQKCFVDHIESWSTNEITINWNAPLVWVTAWLDEHAN